VRATARPLAHQFGSRPTLLLLFSRQAREFGFRTTRVFVAQPEGPTARNQSSKWLTMPSASFGSNQVDFGGMIAPASATAMRSLICVG